MLALKTHHQAFFLDDAEVPRSRDMLQCSNFSLAEMRGMSISSIGTISNFDTHFQIVNRYFVTQPGSLQSSG